MHAALDGLLLRAQWQKGCCWASGWPGTHRGGEGVSVDRWMGVSEPVKPLQFAYLNEVSNDRYF